MLKMIWIRMDSRESIFHFLYVTRLILFVMFYFFFKAHQYQIGSEVLSIICSVCQL